MIFYYSLHVKQKNRIMSESQKKKNLFLDQGDYTETKYQVLGSLFLTNIEYQYQIHLFQY